MSNIGIIVGLAALAGVGAFFAFQAIAWVFVTLTGLYGGIVAVAMFVVAISAATLIALYTTGKDEEKRDEI